MEDVVEGDRVESGQNLGTVLPKELLKEENEVNEHNKGNNGANSMEDGKDDCTLLVEWDDPTQGELKVYSRRVRRVNEAKKNILKCFEGKLEKGCKDSEIGRVLEERLSWVDSWKSCSLVNADQVYLGNTFESEFRNKYLEELEDLKGLEKDEKDNFDRKYEFVGMQKASKHFSDPSKLYSVSLNDCKISKIGKPENFPRCLELYIYNNLLRSSEINRLTKHFPRLEVLNVSKNNVDEAIEGESLRTLIMNGCNLEFEKVLETLDRSRKLAHLVVTDNYMSEVPLTTDRTYPLVRSIDLSNNLIYRWKCLLNLFKLFPNLRKLVVENNLLSDLDLEVEVEEGPLEITSLVELDISSNLVSDSKTLERIWQIFPNLENLKIRSNLIDYRKLKRVINKNRKEDGSNGMKNGSDEEDKHIKDNFNEILRMFSIVTFPKLKVLNGTSVTEEERKNSERYLNYLENKDENKEKKVEVKGMPSNKIKILLIPDGDSESFMFEPVEKRLPETCTVGDVKLLCSKLFNMNLKDIRLVYNNKKMPISEELEDDSADLGKYGISDGYQIRAQNKQIII